MPRLRAIASLAGSAPYAQSLSSLAPAFRASASTASSSSRPMPRRRLVGQTTTSAVASFVGQQQLGVPDQPVAVPGQDGTRGVGAVVELEVLVLADRRHAVDRGHFLDQGIDRVAELTGDLADRLDPSRQVPPYDQVSSARQ